MVLVELSESPLSLLLADGHFLASDGGRSSESVDLMCLQLSRRFIAGSPQERNVVETVVCLEGCFSGYSGVATIPEDILLENGNPNYAPILFVSGANFAQVRERAVRSIASCPYSLKPAGDYVDLRGLQTQVQRLVPRITSAHLDPTEAYSSELLQNCLLRRMVVASLGDDIDS